MYELWTYNCREHKGGLHGLDVLVSHSPRSFIIGAFVWCSTSEGSHYWGNLEREWVEYLTKYDID